MSGYYDPDLERAYLEACRAETDARRAFLDLQFEYITLHRLWQSAQARARKAGEAMARTWRQPA